MSLKFDEIAKDVSMKLSDQIEQALIAAGATMENIDTFVVEMDRATFFSMQYDSNTMTFSNRFRIKRRPKPELWSDYVI